MRRGLLAVVLVAAVGAPSGATAATEPGTSSNFQLVGHDPLFNRGMNASPAYYDAGDDQYVYVGDRTDGSPHHPQPGVLVVKVSDPANPHVVGEIGPPNEGNIGETSRELRVWPQEGLLLVLNFGCSSLIHACLGGEVRGSNIKFYDVADDPENPPLVATYRPSRTPHEFYLWVDPARPGRALIYNATPTFSTTLPNMIVTDISRARDRVFEEIATFNANAAYDPKRVENEDIRLHSMSVSVDGTRTYLAYLAGGMLVVDSSDVADGVPPYELTLLTPPENSPSWPNYTVHSAVKLFGRDLVLTTDEIYGDLLDRPVTRNDHGCPWGWVHLIEVSDPEKPRLVGEYRIEENTEAYCESLEGGNPANTFFTSYAAHNPTVLDNLAFVTWHSGGLQAIQITKPMRPVQAGYFSPEPLPFVFTEDPALSLGLNKVVAWSYPIIADGLIYIVDVRNGLYVLRYTGRHANKVREIEFLEGNSNLGDALRLER